MKRLPLGFLVIGVLLCQLSCSQPPPSLLSVRILEKFRPTKATVWEYARRNRTLVELGSEGIICTVYNGAPKTTVPRLILGSPSSTVSIEANGLQRSYRGQIEVTADTDDRVLVIINRVPLEAYIAAVVRAETGTTDAMPASMRAMAVVSRTFVSLAPRHRESQLCDMAHCQLYHGILPGIDSVRKVIGPVTGYRMRLPPGEYPAYHSCCGGRLSHYDAAWNDRWDATAERATDELAGRILCSDSPNYRWERTVSRERVARTIQKTAGLNVEKVLGWTSDCREPAGRTVRFTFRVISEGREQTIDVRARRFASAYGTDYDWRLFRSLFIEKIVPREDSFLLSGKGFGHGVGMCMAGSATLARKGWNEWDILGFYFPGAKFLPPDTSAPRIPR